MELNTAEKFLLIVMHPDKSRYLIPETRINPGLFGSMLMDLSLNEKIKFEDNRIMHNSNYTKLSEAHNILLGKIAASKKKKRIKTWIARFVWNSRKYRHMILRDLALKGKIRLEDKRFLIFPYKSAYVMDKNGRKSLLENLKDLIMKNKTMDNESASILGIIDACKMHKIITPDKDSLKIVKGNLKEMVQHDSVSKEVQQVIKELQAAAVAATVATGS